jgi:hypothetical protein
MSYQGDFGGLGRRFKYVGLADREFSQERRCGIRGRRRGLDIFGRRKVSLNCTNKTMTAMNARRQESTEFSGRAR